MFESNAFARRLATTARHLLDITNAPRVHRATSFSFFRRLPSFNFVLHDRNCFAITTPTRASVTDLLRDALHNCNFTRNRPCALLNEHLACDLSPFSPLSPLACDLCQVCITNGSCNSGNETVLPAVKYYSSWRVVRATRKLFALIMQKIAKIRLINRHYVITAEVSIKKRTQPLTPRSIYGLIPLRPSTSTHHENGCSRCVTDNHWYH